MNSWTEITDYIVDNLQTILLLIIGLKIGGKLLKAAAVVISAVVFIVIVISFIETTIGYEIPFFLNEVM